MPENVEGFLLTQEAPDESAVSRKPPSTNDFSLRHFVGFPQALIRERKPASHSHGQMVRRRVPRASAELLRRRTNFNPQKKTPVAARQTGA
jgi:hypothetical protein